MVNLSEILHASTHGLYKYTCKVKKPAADTMRPPAAARRGRSERHSRALVQKEGRSKEGRKEGRLLRRSPPLAAAETRRTDLPPPRHSHAALELDVFVDVVDGLVTSQ